MKAFAVVNSKLRIYTVISARDSQHAINKANRLWSGNWDNIYPVLTETRFLYPQFLPTRSFNKQIKNLPEITKKETNSRPPLRT